MSPSEVILGPMLLGFYSFVVLGFYSLVFSSLVPAMKASRVVVLFGSLNSMFAALNLSMYPFNDSSCPCLTVKRLLTLLICFELEVN